MSRNSRGRFQRAPRSTPTNRLSGRTPNRVHRRQRRVGAAPVRPVARLSRCHRHRWDRRSEAAVLVARRHVDRVFRPRQAEESGGRGRRAGRHLRCAGREGRRVESHGDNRVRPEHHLRGTLPSVGGRRSGATRHAGRLRPRREFASMARLPAGRHPLPLLREGQHRRAARGVRRAPRSAGVHARLATLPIGIGGGVRADIRSRAWCAALRGRRPVAGAALRRRGAQARRGSAHVASGRGCEHAVPLGDAECIGRFARHGGDADGVRRAAGHRRARWDGRANVRAPITELAAPVPGREADGAADSRSGTGQSRHLGRGPSGRQPRPRHHGHRFRSSSPCGLRMGCGWRTDPAP